MSAQIAAMVTGESMFAKYTGGRSTPAPEEVARLAYEFYEKRGRLDGYALDDWLAAEQRLKHHYR